MSAMLAWMALLGQEAPPAAAAPAPCELHLWSAVKRFPPGSRFAGPAAPKGSFHADRAQPLANINVIDPDLRLSRVPDAAFDGLFGAGVPITVVRHRGALDPGTAKKAKAPLAPRAAACSGDLVLSDLYDIDYNGGDPPQGLLVAALAAPAGMNMRVTFRRFGPAGKLVYSKGDGVNGAMTVSRSHWFDDPAAAIVSIDESVAGGIRAFVAAHGNESGRQD
ncbi:MAG: hypothetical protein V4574_07720 [Pseudomonadota bacterium]